MWLRGATDPGRSTCVRAAEGVLLYLCVCMRTGANLLWGGSTRISIIRGLARTPLAAPKLCFTSLSHHPCAALPSIHLLIPPSSQPVTPLSLDPSLSLLNAVQLLIRAPLCYSPPLTSSSYTYPYHYLLHCRHLAQQLGITSSHPGGVLHRDTEHQSLDVPAVSGESDICSEHWPSTWERHRGKAI